MTIYDVQQTFRFDRHNSHFLRLGQKILMRLTEFKSRRKLRSSLAKLSEKDLRDFSLTRHDVQASCNLPLSCNAADELRKIAKTRVGNW